MSDNLTLRAISRRADLLIGGAVFVLVFALYVATLAPGLVFGDPAEYTFVPHIWGIAHPPGYAFQTVLGGLWQRLVPIGSIAYRANLLSAAAGAGIAALVYGAARALTPSSLGGPVGYLPGLLAGASAGAATDIWQHSLHANAHIVTALLATASLFLLLRWWRSGQDGELNKRWLFAFCLVAGLSVTHHPLLAFSFPAYAAFILVVWPGVVYSAQERAINWRTPLTMVGFALLGLSVWLYLPLRASLPAPLFFGPDNVNTLDGFLDLVMARGLRVNLFYFGLRDLPDRLLVFWSLLRLQASLLVIGLMAVGLAWLWARRWRVALLYTLFVVINVGFIINTIQDVMAYLMVPFGALLALAGVGAIALLEWMRLRTEAETRLVRTTLALTLLAIPLGRAALLAPLVSLRNYREAEEWVAEVYDTFEGKGEGAILLNHWEHLTPLWYEEWVEGRPLDEADVRLVFVATTSARPWVDNVWANIDAGPVYVSGYQRELIDEGFRLRPIGPHLYRVLPPPAVEPAEMAIMLDADAGPLTVVGVDLPVREVLPGEVIPLSVALTAPEPLADIVFPYTTLSSRDSEEQPPITFQYTTDSHWLTPYWEPGEVIVERYDLRAPLRVEPGEYELRLGLRNLSTGEELTFTGGETTLDLGTITIGRSPIVLPDLAELLADIGHTAGLEGAVATANGQRRAAVWQEPLVVETGDTIRVRLAWTALGHPDTNLKVFVHLIDGANRVIAQQDAPPLGGAFPTFLWFPKWVPGQSVVDPYRLTVPEGTPPGDYLIEVGMYGFTTFQRAPFFDPAGNLSGDRFILGVVRVEADSR
jgi:hypothetical protein